MINNLVTHFAANKGSFRNVLVGATSDVSDNGKDDNPSAYIAPADTDSDESTSLPVVQRHEVTIQVTTICDSGDWRQAQDDLFSALLGWQYTSDWAGLEHVSGGLESANGTQFVWVDKFTTWKTISEI